MLKANFNTNDIKKAIARKVARMEEAVIERMKQAGEMFVKAARENASFKDRTGNLRSSIGFVILRNGEAVLRNFKKSGLGADSGEEGISKAIAAAKEVEALFPKGFVLIVVAGMNYAAAVESKNFDVITGSSLIVEDWLKKAIKELNNKN